MEINFHAFLAEEFEEIESKALTLYPEGTNHMQPLNGQLAKGGQAWYTRGARREAISTPVTNQTQILHFIAQTLN
jgi:hypothetical protein